MKNTERDPVADLITNLRGIPGQHVLAAINGNLPEAWYACDLTAHAWDPPPSLRTAVFCTAKRRDRPHGRAAGAKVNVDAGTQDAEPLRLADAIAAQLRGRIAGLAPDDWHIRVALAEGARIPERKTPGASGYDLCALTGLQIQPGRMAVIDTGVTLEMPRGMEAQIRPRSGLASKGIVGTFGTVDADFRAGIRVMLTNQSTEAYTVNVGDRVAQLVFSKVELPELELVDASKLTQTERGSGSLGSTGR